MTYKDSAEACDKCLTKSVRNVMGAATAKVIHTTKLPFGKTWCSCGKLATFKIHASDPKRPAPPQKPSEPRQYPYAT